MKKLIFTLFVVFGSMVAFTGCQDDSEIFDPVNEQLNSTTKQDGGA